MKSFYVYILANRRNGALYTGSISDIVKRIWQHTSKLITGFTAKFNVTLLVYYELHATMFEAARRERRFKNWPPKWKLNLIKEKNPEWKDYMKKFVAERTRLDAAAARRGGGASTPNQAQKSEPRRARLLGELNQKL